MAFLPALERLRVDGDQRADERLRVAHRHRLTDQWVGPQTVLEHRRGDVLAAGGHDELLLAADDLEEPVGVDLAEIAGVEPAVLDRLGGRRVVLPVAVEDDTTLHQQLTVVGDPHAVALQQLSDGAGLDGTDLVDRDGRAGLGQAVALVDGQPDTAVEVAQPGAQRRAARDGRDAVAAEGRLELAVHQLVEHLVLELEQQPRAAGTVQRLAVGDRGPGGDPEDLALPVVGSVLLGRVVDLLEHPRHRHHDGRFEHPEHRHEILDVAGEADGHLVVERSDGDRAGQHVRQRQEHQQPLALVQQRGQGRLGATDLVEQVGMGELAALGSAGGTRGVDQGGRVGGPDSLDPAGHLAGIDRGAGRREFVECSGARPVDGEVPAQVRQPAGEVGDDAGMGVGLRERHHRAGILQHPLHLIGRGRLVDGNRQRADRQDGHVDDRPLETGRGEDRDPVTGLHAERDQSLCDRTDLGRRFGARHIDPVAVDLALVDGEPRVGAFVVVDDGDDVVGLGDVEGCRNTQLAQIAVLP